MKLPDKRLLENSEMRLLYNYDIDQLFNPDPRSVARFAYESRLNLILNTIMERLVEGRVLDVGCAQGNYTLLLAAKGINCAGLDLRPSFLRYAKLKADKIERMNSDFVVANAEYLPFRSEIFDTVILGEILGLFSKPIKVLEESKRVLKSKCLLLVSTPNADCLSKSKERTYADLKSSSVNELEKLQYCADKHVFHFKREELVSFLSKRGFRNLKFKFIWFLPFFLFKKFPLLFSRRFLNKIEMILLSTQFVGRKLALGMVEFAEKC